MARCHYKIHPHNSATKGCKQILFGFLISLRCKELIPANTMATNSSRMTQDAESICSFRENKITFFTISLF